MHWEFHNAAINRAASDYLSANRQFIENGDFFLSEATQEAFKDVGSDNTKLRWWITIEVCADDVSYSAGPFAKSIRAEVCGPIRHIELGDGLSITTNLPAFRPVDTTPKMDLQNAVSHARKKAAALLTAISDNYEQITSHITATLSKVDAEAFWKSFQRFIQNVERFCKHKTLEEFKVNSKASADKE